jgi:peptide/nickel transport system permease protein
MSADPSAMTSREAFVLATGNRLRRRVAGEQRWSKATFVAGGTIILAILLASLVTPFLGLDKPDDQHLLSTLQAPSLAHPFGTDSLGRDILTRCLYAAKTDLLFAAVVTYAPVLLGVTLGALAGYFGGWLDAFVMRLVDTVMAFPFLVLILAFVAAFGPGLRGAYVGVLVIGWSIYARLARGEMLALREREFMLAARTCGYSNARVIFRHGVPNLLQAPLVFSMADMVLNIVLLASLSYLGLGVQPPTPEWGAMVADGQSYLLTSWWVATLPGLTIVLVGLGFSLLGDGLAERFGQDFRLTG